MDISELPKYHELMKPTLIGLDKIGGSASLNEINDAVIELAGLPAPALDVQYESGAGAVLTDRLSWARSHLKEGGFLASGGRGIWLLTDEGRQAKDWPTDSLRRKVATAIKAKHGNRKKSLTVENDIPSGNPDADFADWRDELLAKLRSMDPSAFERLALLWQKCDFWDSQTAISLIHGEPALWEAGDGRGLAGRSGDLAGTISSGFAAQDPGEALPSVHRRPDWSR